MTTNKLAIEVFRLFAECIKMGYTNPFIRWLYKDGADFIVEAPGDTHTYYRLPPDMITDEFLNVIRRVSK